MKEEERRFPEKDSGSQEVPSLSSLSSQERVCPESSSEVFQWRVKSLFDGCLAGQTKGFKTSLRNCYYKTLLCPQGKNHAFIEAFEVETFLALQVTSLLDSLSIVRWL